MEISRQVEEIIEKRKKRLPVIEAKLKTLEDMASALKELENLRSQMVTPDGEVIPGSRFAPMLQENPDLPLKIARLDAEGVKTAWKKAKRYLEEYRQRCDREQVNISIVGMARIGKSKFLQSLSGLGDKVIPAFSGSDCTGAPSIIYNMEQGDPFMEGHALKAVITFKTEEDMVEDARTYIETMGIPEEILEDWKKHPSAGEKVRWPRRLGEIKQLDLEGLREAKKAGDSGGIKLKYLRKLVESFDEWEQCVGSDTRIFYEEDEIMKYVAQNNGKPEKDPDREAYFNYQAVKTCKIYCSFPNPGLGKICLIDTVGLGDHTNGILDDMIETVKMQSDAVIFNHMPVNGSGGGFPEPVKHVYDGIYEACADRELDKWLHYFINEVVEPPSPAIPKNGEFCEEALKTIQDPDVGLRGSENAKIISAVDSNAVQEDFLIPMLQKVSENLEVIDETYRKPAEEALKQLQGIYQGFCIQAQKAMTSDIRNNAKAAPLINQKTEEGRKTLRKTFYRMVQEWQEKRNQPCAVIYNFSQEIFQKMSNPQAAETFLPARETILEELDSGEIPNDVYTKYAHIIRNQISKAFLDMDAELGDVITAMKNQVAQGFIESCHFDTVCAVPEEGQPVYEWLADFTEGVLGEEYPNIRLAVETIYQFKFSVKSFLTYEVRNCLDDLDLYSANIPPLVSKKDGSTKRTAQNISNNLYTTTTQIKQKLEYVLKDVFIKPNRAMYAEIIDFFDRVIYADGVEMEWRNFFADKSMILWKDDILAQQQVQALNGEWIQMIETLQGFNRSSVFKIGG